MKKSFLRIVSLLMFASLTLAFFAGCENANDGKDENLIKVIDNGQSMYTVVYPKNASPAVKAELQRFLEAIKEATGVMPESKTDEIKRGALYDSTTPEILFGRTGYDETKTVNDALSDHQFAVRAVGNKLVFTSPKDANLSTLVDYVCDTLLKNNVKTEKSGNKTLFFEEYTSSVEEESINGEAGALKDFMIGSAKLSEYVIVYDSDMPGCIAVVSELRKSIEEAYGIRLPMYSDAHYEDKNAPEILVGRTNRTVSEELYLAAGTQLLMTYRVGLRGNRLQLIAGGAFSMRQCANTTFAYLETFSKDGDYLATDLAPKSEKLAAGADIRIMTSNVLAARWGEQIKDTDSALAKCPPTVERAEIYAAMLADYQPDVIGMQEACDVWGDNLPYYLEILKKEYGLEYTWIHKTVNGKMSMTPILYRSDKYEIVETAVQPLSYWAAENKDYYIRLFAWAKMKEKANTAREFVVINTHWELSARVDKVQKCINEEIALINTLRNRFNLPIICTGDFNSKQDSADYVRFMEEADVVETRVVARENGGLINQAGGCGNLGSMRNANSGNYIDHIYTTKDCNTLRYETLIYNYNYYMTDHSPMIADIMFR